MVVQLSVSASNGSRVLSVNPLRASVCACARFSGLASAIASCIPFAAFAQLEEILVTATRRETSLQDTPLSIQAFTAEQLELGGITNGRDLGIMVPNVVLNPGTGGASSSFYIRGLPGVGLYVDGVWQDGFGFQQMDFAEMERVEVLRGPQGTLFGRNTNGGAVNMTTRRPADEFAARMKLNVGNYNRREAQLAVDLPLNERLKTKFMGATFSNDGFIEGLTTPWDHGSQDDTILRADIVWEPTDSLSFRVTHNDEQKRGTDPRLHRMTRYDNSKVYAYNTSLGAYQSLANAACQADLVRCAAIGAGGASVGYNYFTGTGWATPPNTGIGGRYTGDPASAFNYSTHTNNYAGGKVSAFGDVINGVYVPNARMPDIAFGPGEVGKWQTKSDGMEDGITADLEYTTFTTEWDIGDRLKFEAILSRWEQTERQVIDFDGTEFLITIDDIPRFRANDTRELHLSGSALDDRITWLAGYYSLKEDLTQRFYRWGMWDYAVPAPSQVVNGFAVPPRVNVAAAEYVRQTAILLGLNGVTGGNMLTGNSTVPQGAGATNRYPWAFTQISDDALTGAFDDDQAWFGEATFGITEKIDITLGARISDKSGGDIRYQPTDAFRTTDPAIRPQGDPLAGTLLSVTFDPDTPKINTYKFSLAYRPKANLMMYATYAEGFTSAGAPLVTIGPTAVVPPGGTRVSATQATIPLPAEVIENKELGLRSDWLDGRLRFNATYFDSLWNGMRVTLYPLDAVGNTQPFPYNSGEGAGTADGWEFEVIWAPTDRLQINGGLGLIDTNYIQAGVFDGVTGNYPGTPFAYAPDLSGTVGAQYEIPLGNGGRFLLVGNYGYMGEYIRDPAYQRIEIDANGNPIMEPAYGILNTRVVYEPAARNYSLEVWGKNLTDEQYINGGFDSRDTFGYNYVIVGRAREVGVSLSFTF